MPLSPATKLVSEVIANVKRQFGDESGAQITDADIIRWINDGQLELNKKSKVIKTIATTTSVAGQNKYDLPGVKILEVERLQYKNTAIEYRTFQQVQETIFDDVADVSTLSADIPTCWYDYGDSIYFFPVPSTNGVTITLFCVTYPTTVSSTTDALSLPDVFYDALVQYIMAKAYEMDDDWTAAGNKLTQLENNLNSLNEDGQGYGNQFYHSITVLEDDA